MYRWFLRHFPRGGSYADIHHALIEEGYTDWAESLVEYAWKKWLADETEGAGSEHIGIYNVRQRLRIAYEGRAQLHVGNAQPHGARVEILIPRIGFSGEEGASGR